MAKGEYFEGNINEFVDWISGYNETEGVNQTGGLPSSGGSIRDLLQSHLKKPIYKDEDEVNGVMRLFSSKRAFDLWKEDPDKYANLLLVSFPIPHGYSIKLFDEDEDGNLKETSLNYKLYLKYGDTVSDSNRFHKFFTVNEGDKDLSRSVTVKLTIKAYGYVDKSITATFNAGDPIDFDLSEYLHKGENTIVVDTSANINGRLFKESSRSYTIMVLELQASTSYSYNSSGGRYGDIMSVTLNVKNTANCGYNAFIKIDDQDPQMVQNDVQTTNSDVTFEPNIANLEEGVHTLQLKFSVTVMNNTKQKVLDSNIVYIKFVKYKSESNSRYDLVSYIDIDNTNGSLNDLLSGEDIPTLYLTQYTKFSLNYALESTVTSVTKKVKWNLLKIENNQSETLIDSFEADVAKQVIQDLTFTPSVFGDNYRLRGFIENESQYELKMVYNVVINKANIQIAEQSGYKLKLENTSNYSNANNRKWEYGQYSCLFNRKSSGASESPAFPWNSVSGWDKECLHISPGDYMYLEYPFFRTDINGDIPKYPHDEVTGNNKGGITIEVEFEFRNVTNSDDEIIVIGGEASNKCKIVFTPNSASIYSDSGGDPLVTTNFKANERIKLAFSIFPVRGNYDQDVDLVTIVNNGILERANIYGSSRFTSEGNIQIGKENAGADIYIYRIRAYDFVLSPEELFCNFAIDSPNKSEILERNNVLSASGNIEYKAVLNKLPVVLITGELQKVIANTTKDYNLNVDLAKVDSVDTEKNFFIKDCRIRRHGQSTLNYPIPSFKIWSNSNFYNTFATSVDFNKKFQAKLYKCVTDDNGYPQPDVTTEAYKGRYQMKENSIPANKWVLQANYADSSGVHNGGIMRLIQESWYNALVKVTKDGVTNEYYKLRTPPQLIASIDKQRHNLDEDDFYATAADKAAYDRWLLNTEGKKECMYEYNDNGKVKLWSDDDTLGEFPYEIRVAPDSYPCVVFYREYDGSPIKFLGQYVFMDDKKSDYVYGERSIYRVSGDPFCLQSRNAELSKKYRRLWNNKYCSRIEVVHMNNAFVGYRSHSNADGNFGDIVTIYQKNSEDQYVDQTGQVISQEDLDAGRLSELGVNLGLHPNWQNSFQLVYPDIEEEDLEPGQSMNEAENEAAGPFIALHAWLVSTYDSFRQNGGTQELINSSRETGSNHIAFQAFRDGARDHLDLYKLAAYYICFLRFGLVDSVERNAQLKTYDGQHWHYEPWDMDIALGNQNTGGIKWNPPMTRATNNSYIAAYSGTHLDNEGIIDESNWLWDALEVWPEWINTIVPNVAEALAKTLTYDHICEVLDEEYAAKWCERLYNLSGHIKYIETNGDNKYAWLQGARTSHRHWWLKTSMDYYDAKWICGDFRNDYLYINIKNNVTGNPYLIKITPSTKGYFCYGIEVNSEITIQKNSLVSINGNTEGNIRIPSGTNLEAKHPFYLYGAGNIKGLDLSDVYNEPAKSGGIEKMFFGNIGSNLKYLNVGVPIDLMTSQDHIVNGQDLELSGGDLRSVEELNIQGCINSKYKSLLEYTEKLKRLYAIGSNVSEFVSNYYATENLYTGGRYEVLQLPNTVTSLEFHDSSWIEDNGESDPTLSQGLTFWSYDVNTGELQKVNFEDTDVTTLRLLGTTANNICAINLMKAFINKAIADTEHIADYTLEVENLNIDGTFVEQNPGFTFTYTDLMNMAQLNKGKNNILPFNYKGYLRLTSIDTQDLNSKIQAIQTAFGTNVFTKNSYKQNLVVDFQIGGGNQIFVSLSDDNKGYYNPNTNTVTEGYLDASKKSPNYLIVRASRFLLPDADVTKDIFLVINNSEVPLYQGAKVSNNPDLKLYIPEMSRDRQTKTVPSSLTIRVRDNSATPPVTGEASVNIAHKVYPSSVGVRLLNSSQYKCFTKKDLQGNVEATLNTASGILTVELGYPGGTSDEDKASINSIELIPSGSSSGLLISSSSKGVFNITYDGVVPSPENKREYILDCKINYASGDDNDNFQIKLTLMEDEEIVTSTSNSHLYSVLSNYLINGNPIPCMEDASNHKIFTRSSLASINSVIFEDEDTESAFYGALSGLTSFDVDINDDTKGTLFDYISKDTEVIILNGCTSSGLQNSPIEIDLSSFNKLTKFEVESSAYIDFKYAPENRSTLLSEITIYNAYGVYLENIGNSDFVLNAYTKLLHLGDVNMRVNNLNVTLDYSNLRGLFIENTIESGGSKMWEYLMGYIGRTPTPNGIPIELNWNKTFTVLLANLKYLKDYTQRNTNQNIVLNGNVTTKYYTEEVKTFIDSANGFPELVSNWGEPCLEIVPTSLHNYMVNIVDPVGGIISGGNRGTLSGYSVKSIYWYSGSGHKGYPTTPDWSTDKNLVENLLWFKHMKGGRLTHDEGWDSKFPNVSYLYWPSDGVGSARNSFEIAKSAGIKAKAFVTDYKYPPYNGDPYSGDLIYQLLFVTEESALIENGWYDRLAASGIITSGYTDEDDKVNALKSIGIICRDANGIGFITSKLQSLTEEYLQSMLDDNTVNTLSARQGRNLKFSNDYNIEYAIVNNVFSLSN